MARPRLEIDEDQLRKLASLQCSLAEIASVVKCSVDTLERYSEVIKEGRETGKCSLKRMQFQVAMKGNCSMLIWLGKNYLGQKDKSQEEIDALKIGTNINAETLAQAFLLMEKKKRDESKSG